jgi:hypothetical protein
MACRSTAWTEASRRSSTSSFRPISCSTCRPAWTSTTGSKFPPTSTICSTRNALLSFDRERGGRARLGFNIGQPRQIGITLRKRFGN